MADEKHPQTWVTYALIAANVVMFGVEVALGADPLNPTPQQVLDAGGSVAPYTFGGEPWRLGSSMFLHYGLLHIGLNMFCLWQGRITELIYGRAAFAVLYVVSGLVGGVVAILYQPMAVSAGASSAVFGVYGAFTAFIIARRKTIPKDVWQSTVRAIGMFLVLNLIIGLSVRGISLAAHAGGLLFGLLGGLAILWKTEGQPRVLRVVAVAVAGGALVAIALVASSVPAPSPKLSQEARVVKAALTELGGTERTVGAVVTGLKRLVASGKLPAVEAAPRVEQDVIDPWRIACARFLEHGQQDDADIALFEAGAAFCDARWMSWQKYADALRATGSKREELMQDHGFLELQAKKLGAELQAQEQKLR